jgi:hypothetical protein
MRHNKFDYEHDMLRPLQYFFFYHQIGFEPKMKSHYLSEKFPEYNNLRRSGYLETTIRSSSKYFNNFNRFPPSAQLDLFHVKPLMDQDYDPPQMHA